GQLTTYLARFRADQTSRSCPPATRSRLHVRGLQVRDEQRRPLYAVRDVTQEAGGDIAVADPVVEGQAELGDLAYGELPVEHPRLVDDAAHPEQRRLRVVDDRSRAVHTEHAVVVERERAAGQPGRRQRARPRLREDLVEGGGQVERGEALRVVEHRYHQ